MVEESIAYEIRETATPDGGVALELVVEGSIVAHATVSAALFDAMRTELGLTREAVIGDLRKSLLAALKTQGQFVEITDVKEDPRQQLRFSGRFTHRLWDKVSTGVVWYEVDTSATGPEDLPAVVRNKMRLAVHRELTDAGTAARALVDLHK